MSKPDLKPVGTKPDLSPEELKAMVKAERVAREQRAIQRINQVLAEERCVMHPVIVLSGQSMISRVEIAAQD